MALDDIDGAEIAASIEMLRDDTNKSMLIVEGVSDRKFFNKFYDRHKCEIIVAHGRENALDAMRILLERAFPGILCIVDTDYNDLFMHSVSDDSIIQTDEHDIETMMIRSEALESVVVEMGSAPKVKALADAGRTLEEILLALAVPLGIMRIYSISTESNLRFRELEYKFISKGGDIDESAMIKKIFDHSGMPKPHYTEPTEYVKECRATHGHHWAVCCGHDLTAILGRLFQGLLGNHNSTTASKEEIESRLRLAYDRDDFRKTSLFSGIRAWEARSAPYSILLAAI